MEGLIPRDLISRRKAAEMLGVSVPTVKRMLEDGLLSGYRIGRRLVRIPKEVIVDYLATHCVGGSESNEDKESKR